MHSKMVTISSFRLFTSAFAGMLAFSTCLPAQAQTNYADVGTTFLNTVHNAYLKQLANSKGSAVALYASTIDANNGNAKSAEIAQLWTEDILEPRPEGRRNDCSLPL